MFINFNLGKKSRMSLVGALISLLMLFAGCNDPETVKTDNGSGGDYNSKPLPPNNSPEKVDVGPEGIVPVGAPPVDAIEVWAKTDPDRPQLERYLDDWRFQIVNIDDEGRQLSPIYYAESDYTGHAAIVLPTGMYSLPLVITAYNDAYPPIFNHDEEGIVITDDHENFGECRSYQIFVPPFCYNKTPWIVGPFEDALWNYYRRAAERRADAWDPSMVDCATWVANMNLLLGTDEIHDELEDLSQHANQAFHDEVLIDAFQESQQTLVPTRPPICMAERRHNGGGLDRGQVITSFPHELETHDKPIYIGSNGIVTSICDIDFTGSLIVNGNTFAPTKNFKLDEADFPGTVHEEFDINGHLLNTFLFNVRGTNGREREDDKWEDACALTTLIEFVNEDDDEQDVHAETGVTFTNLFGADTTTVFLTSDGDNVVDERDTWAIFYTGSRDDAKVVAVELIGHRQEDFRDVLRLGFDTNTEDLFIGLKADFELNEEEIDGERAFYSFTLSTWDASDLDGKKQVRYDIGNCYEGADVWARQFFVTREFQGRDNDCCFKEHCQCEIDRLIRPLRAAEFAVRSQCFSNSRSNQRWQPDDVGFWDMNAHHGVHGNVVINPGWLAPFLDFEIYIQKFDEAVFKGPRTVVRTDEVGQIMVAIPTLVEGDRVLLKAEDGCCDDYDLVLPCVPEFTGFAGIPGVPYVPYTVAPPPAGGAIGPGVPGVPVPATVGPVGGAVVGPVASGPGQPKPPLAKPDRPGKGKPNEGNGKKSDSGKKNKNK